MNHPPARNKSSNHPQNRATDEQSPYHSSRSLLDNWGHSPFARSYSTSTHQGRYFRLRKTVTVVLLTFVTILAVSASTVVGGEAFGGEKSETGKKKSAKKSRSSTKGGKSRKSDKKASSQKEKEMDNKKSTESANEEEYNLLPLTPVKWPFSSATEAAVAQGAWQTAWKEIGKTDPISLEPDLSFLAGYVAMKVGEPSYAYKAFQRASTYSPFKDLASLWAARAAFAQNQYVNAVGWAAKVDAGSIYHNDSNILLTRALVAEGRYAEALNASHSIRALNNLEAKLLYADIQLLSSKHAEKIDPSLAKNKELAQRFRHEKLLTAAPIYQEIAQRYPTQSESSYAASQLNELLKSNLFSESERKKYNSANYTQEATLARFDNLADAYKNERVTEELPKIIKSWEKGEEKCHAMYLIAKSFTRLRKHIDSIPWYESVIEECTGKDRRNALYMGGKAAWNSNQKEQAINHFNRLLSEFGEHSYADDVLYFKARIHREESKEKEARETLNQLVKIYPSGDMAKDAHWLIIRDAFKGNRLTNIVNYINELKSFGEDDLYTKGRLTYFKGVALLDLKKKKEAAAAFTKVVNEEPMSYYALLALNRLAIMNAKSSWRPAPGENLCDPKIMKKLGNLAYKKICAGLPILTAPELRVTPSVATKPSFLQGLKLVELNLESQAKAPFRALRKHLKGGDEDLWALAYLLDLAGAYPLSHDIIRRELPDTWVNGYPRIKEPNGLKRWSLAYPRPFKELVEKWAAKRGLQPAIIWAVMREESGFNPNIESWANAVGLMQLLPKTAQHVANIDKAGKITKPELFEPDTAIRFGSGYIGELGNNSGGNPIYMIAGYNGGWANVSRWQKEFNESIDLYVEDIPYGQTRNYTKRVLSSYWAYLMGGGGVYIPYVM